jgi:ribonuclease HI
MKQLKFNHNFAELIRADKKTATFRMYDDKDLSVNDRVELLDKVDPDRPATWKLIGTARIDSIVEKRFSDIDEDDLYKTEEYDSKDEMLATYRRYYGSQVTSSMPIKVIRFTVLKTGVNSADSDDKRTTTNGELILYADGGSRGNPGPSAAGYVIMSKDNEILDKRGLYIGVTTNNQAEYTALKLGLEELQKMRVRKVHVYMDSLLVVNQMLGIFKVKNRDLWPIHDMAKRLTATFEHVSFTHVPRTMNKIADDAVNEALDEAAKRLS